MLQLQRDILNLNKSISCPVTLDTFKEPVHLVPCGHAIEFEVAQKIFGCMDRRERLCMHQRHCPLCNRITYGYHKSPLLKELIGRISIALENNSLFYQSLLLQPTSATINQAYPGNLGSFSLAEDNWEYQYTGTDLCQRLFFINEIPNAFIKEFYLLGYFKNSYSIMIKFDQKAQNIQSFFKQFKLELDDRDLKFGIFKSETETDLKKLFALVAKYNAFPPFYFAKMAEIVGLEEGSQ
jgi:hypothetical protein